MERGKIKIVIADDSAIIRGLLGKLFAREEDFEIVASVSNGRKAVDAVEEFCADVVVSDNDMPELSGLEITKILVPKGIPVIIFSDDKKIRTQATVAGAALFYEKPALSKFSIEGLKDLPQKIRSCVKVIHPSVHNSSHSSRKGNFRIVVLGASTGGPTAVQTVLSSLNSSIPVPILYVQHIDIGSDKKMVDWFNSECPNISVHLARNGEEALPGNVYMAPADKHLVIDYVKDNGHPVLKLSDEPEERFLRPAVNKLFRSAAKLYGAECLGVLMTGMGQDGAEGCKMIIEDGGYTIAESKETCAVFGMPSAAIEMNAASEVLPRTRIPMRILELIAR